MNGFIKKTNLYLLTHYPNIWNTRLVWMLAIGVALHLLFFIGGFFAIQFPGILHDYSNSDESFMGKFGIILFSIIISLVTLVIWIVALLKNNAFKNYYPHSQQKLFLSFLYFFFIFLVHSSYYLSFSLGYKTFLNNRYTDSTVNKYIEKGDLASVFFNFSPTDYDLKNKKYPSPFDTIYIEKNSSIEDSQPSISTARGNYQFYTIISDTCNQRSDDWEKCYEKYNEHSITSEYLTSDKIVYYSKGVVLDLSDQVDTTLNYFNFSTPFFSDFLTRYDNNNYSSYYDEKRNAMKESDLIQKAFFEKVYQILKKNDKAAIEKIMTEFLAVTQEMHISTNLTIDNWMQLVYHPEGFVVDSFIYNGNMKNVHNLAISEVYMSEMDDAGNERSAIDEAYFRARWTSLFLDADALKNQLNNIQRLRPYEFLGVWWKVHLWIAFGFATFLFMFRVTNLKAMIFSWLSVGVLSVLVALLLLLFNLGVGYGSSATLINLYFILGIGLLVLLLPLTFGSTFSKMIKGVFVNATLGLVVIVVLLIIGVIDEHYRMAASINTEDNHNYISIFTRFSEIIFWGLLIFGLLFNYLYSQYIIKWKGLPEA